MNMLKLFLLAMAVLMGGTLIASSFSPFTLLAASEIFALGVGLYFVISFLQKINRNLEKIAELLKQ